MIRNIAFLALALVLAVQAQDKIKISTNNGTTTIEATKSQPGKWKCKFDKAEFTAKAKNNEVELYLGDNRFAGGKIKSGKLNITKNNGTALFSLKFYDDKIKLYVGDSTEPIEFKVREDKYKVVIKDNEIGKAKFYKDTGKTKAKNAKDETLAETKDLKKVSAVLAPLVVPDLDKDIRIYVMLTLLALDK